jgi:antitoxin component YwqK of YwqJK toxin-antitoxin module
LKLVLLLTLATLAGACGQQVDSWPNGVRRSEGRIDWSGRRQGGWSWWYPDGELRERGTFRAGRRDGLWQQWYASGQKHSEGVRLWDDQARASLREGPWRFWFENGQLRGQGAYEGGRPVGEWRWWTDLGVLDAGRSGRFAAGVRVEPR